MHENDASIYDLPIFNTPPENFQSRLPRDNINSSLGCRAAEKLRKLEFALIAADGQKYLVCKHGHAHVFGGKITCPTCCDPNEQLQIIRRLLERIFLLPAIISDNRGVWMSSVKLLVIAHVEDSAEVHNGTMKVLKLNMNVPLVDNIHRGLMKFTWSQETAAKISTFFNNYNTNTKSKKITLQNALNKTYNDFI